MLITILNETDGLVTDTELLGAMRAISRQIYYDFEPYWNLAAKLRLATRRAPITVQLDPVSGDAVVSLRRWSARSEKDRTLPYCYGFHSVRDEVYPIGYVFVTSPDADDVARPGWTVTLSHEILELIANPHVNLRVLGPHPRPGPGPDRDVYFHREVCDPVQESYVIDGVGVSNFVLPLFFKRAGHETERVDFLGTPGADGALHSFGVKAGGYIPFYDPETNAEVRLGLTTGGRYVLFNDVPVAAHLYFPPRVRSGTTRARSRNTRRNPS